MKTKLPLSASFIALQSAFLAVGVILRTYFVGPVRSINFQLSGESFFVAVSVSIPLIVFAFALVSERGRRWRPLGKIYGFIRASPIRAFVMQGNWFVFAIFSVVASMGEELVFRCVVQEKWGLIISAFLFAAIHPMTLYLIPILFAAGLLFGVSYHAYGDNLLIPFFAHAAYDFVVLTLMRKKFLNP